MEDHTLVLGPTQSFYSLPTVELFFVITFPSTHPGGSGSLSQIGLDPWVWVKHSMQICT